MDQLYWTQSLQSGEKHRFYNPIKQNETHRKALAEYLNVPLSALKSYNVILHDKSKSKMKIYKK